MKPINLNGSKSNNYHQIPISFSNKHLSDVSIVASLLLSSYSKISLAKSSVAAANSPTVHLRSNKTRHTVSS